MSTSRRRRSFTACRSGAATFRPGGWRCRPCTRRGRPAGAPGGAAGLIDDKRVPFEETSAETTRGYFKPPLWRRTYLGRWHGLASTDIRGGTFDLVGQWVGHAKASTELEALGTLTARYSVKA